MFRGELMSRTSANYYRKKLRNKLQSCYFVEFLKQIWSLRQVHLLNSNSSLNSRSQGTGFEVQTEQYGDILVPPWTLEELVNEFCSIAHSQQLRKNRRWNFNQTDGWVPILKDFRRMQDAEDGNFLRARSVMDLLPRMAHQQFPWQSGFQNSEYLLEKTYFMHCEAMRNEFFKSKGVQYSDFSFVLFCLFTQFSQAPILHFRLINEIANQLSLNVEIVERILSIISLEFENLSDVVTAMHSSFHHSSYRPSFLRKYPLIRYGNGIRKEFICPLPELIIVRFSEGGYYDLFHSGDGVIRDRIGKNFEKYCLDLIGGYLDVEDIEVKSEYQYKFEKINFDSSDLLLSKGGNVRCIVECKAKKIPLEMRYKNATAESTFNVGEEISKGIVQLWQYHFHLKSGKSPKHPQCDEDVVLLLLTQDDWLTLAGDRRDTFVSRANELANDAKHYIPNNYRQKVAVASVSQLSSLLKDMCFENVLVTLKSSMRNDYSGYRLGGVANKEKVEKLSEVKEYPLKTKMEIVFPWMSYFI